MMHFLELISAFLLYLAVSLALVATFIAAYTRSTPHPELELIRKGNTAAALGLAGAMIGFALVLSRAISFSSGIGEVVLWGLIGLIVQVAGHWVLSYVQPRLYQAIEDGDMASGIMKGALAITLGLLNAASMTP